MSAAFDTPHQPLTTMHVPAPLQADGATGPNRARFGIAVLLHMMTQAVLFGVGAVVILAGPLAARADVAFPIMIALSVVLGGLIAWRLAPRLQARTWRRKALLSAGR